MPVIEKKLFNLLDDRSWAIDQSKHLSITDLELELLLSLNTLPALAEHLLVAQTSLVAIWDIARHLLATN